MDDPGMTMVTMVSVNTVTRRVYCSMVVIQG